MELHNIELEQQVLGIILLNNEHFPTIAEILEPEHFYDEVHRELYRVFSDRIRAGRGVVRETIVNFLNNWPEMLEVSAAEYMTRLVNNVVVGSSIGQICHEIRDLAVKRSIEGLAQVCCDQAMDDDPAHTVDDAINAVEDAVQDLRGQFQTRQQTHSWGNALNDSLKYAAEAFQSDTDPGWSWCLPELEDVAGERLQPGFLIGMLADSGGGKTSLAIQQMTHSASEGVPVIFFSFEQTPRQVADQVFAQQTDLESREWRRGRVTEEKFDQTVDYAKSISEWPMEIHKMYDARISDIAVRARRFFKKRGRGLMVIDHAKSMNPDNDRAGLASQVNQIYRGAKNMALENEAACLLLMQRNMEGSRRNNPRPMRQDIFGGGGAIENLDVCIALWREIIWLREQYPNLQTEDAKSENTSRQGKVEFLAEFIGLKARFYEQGVKRFVGYTPKFTRFSSVKRKAEDEPELTY